MDFFRAGEALFRQAQPLLPFLAPAVYRPHPPPNSRIRAVTGSCKPPRMPRAATSRPFSTSPWRAQPALADEGSSDAVPAANRPSPSRLAAHTPPRRSSYDDLIAAIGGPPSPGPSSTSQPGGAPARRTRNAPSAYEDISRMLDPFTNPTAFPTARSATGPGGRRPPLDPPPPPPMMERTLPMKLGPSVGRTVQVDERRGMDVGRAFRALESQCNRNSVKRDFMRQRFHERPGLKRKRLKGERWRRRFKEGFKGIVAKVQKMKKQGW